MRALADDQRVESTIRCLAKRRGARTRASTKAPCARHAVGLERGGNEMTAVFSGKRRCAIGEHARRQVAGSAQANVDRLVFREAARRLETETTRKQRVVSEFRVDIQRQVC